jgi:hypothetical protein
MTSFVFINLRDVALTKIFRTNNMEPVPFSAVYGNGYWMEITFSVVD